MQGYLHTAGNIRRIPVRSRPVPEEYDLSWSLDKSTARNGAYDNLVCIGRNVPVGKGGISGEINNIFVSPLGQVVAIEAGIFPDPADDLVKNRAEELMGWTADKLDRIAASYFYRSTGQAANMIDAMAKAGVLSYSSADKLARNVDRCISSGNLIYIALPFPR